MAKQESNGYVKVAWILEADLTDPEFPSATELNTDGLDLSAAIAWEDYELGSTGSDDIEDRALTDLGNAVSRGTANFGATLDFFRDLNNTDASSVYVDAFEAFRTTRVIGYLVTRVGERAATVDFTAGDTISVFKVMAVTTVDMATGENSTKFQVNFLPQGVLYPFTVVSSSSAIGGVAASDTLTAGELLVLNPTLDGSSIRSRATYITADPAVATVSNHGVITGVATGGPTDITVSYGNATDAVIAITVS